MKKFKNIKFDFKKSIVSDLININNKFNKKLKYENYFIDSKITKKQFDGLTNFNNDLYAELSNAIINHIENDLLHMILSKIFKISLNTNLNISIINANDIIDFIFKIKQNGFIMTNNQLTSILQDSPDFKAYNNDIFKINNICKLGLIEKNNTSLTVINNSNMEWNDLRILFGNKNNNSTLNIIPCNISLVEKEGIFPNTMKAEFKYNLEINKNDYQTLNINLNEKQ